MARKYKPGREIHWPDPDLGPWSLVTIWGPSNGRLECVGLQILPTEGGEMPPLTTGTLRSIKLGTLVEEERRDRRSRLTAVVHQVASEGAEGRPASPRVTKAVREAVRAEGRDDEARGRGRPTLYGDDHYAAVADVYTDNSTRKPVVAVAEHFSVSRGTAARWVAMARDRGLLPQTQPGKARGIEREQDK